MQLTILIIESLSNFILIGLLVRSELKIIKGKKMLLEQREREKQIEKEWKESATFLEQTKILKEKELSKDFLDSITNKFSEREGEKDFQERLKNSILFANEIGTVERIFNNFFIKDEHGEVFERNPSKRNHIPESEEFDDNFFEKRKERKKKALETLAMCMGVSVEELKKIRNFDLFPSDRIKRMIDVYLMKPDIDFAISYSVSDMEVEWARKQVFAEKADLKSFQKKNELKCGKAQCFMYNKNSEHNCMSEDFVNCEHFFSENKPNI